MAITNVASFSSESDCTPVKSFFIYPVEGKTLLFKDSLNNFHGEFDSCLEFGKVKKGKNVPSHIGLRNESKKSLMVLVKITAVHYHENWGTRKVEKMKVGERSVPYLMN